MAEAVMQQPEDVLTQILSRLPAKSLIRFRSVCKYWYALIRNPRFISLHLNYHSSKDKNNNEDCLLVKRSLDDPLSQTNFGFSLVPNETPVEDFDKSCFIGHDHDNFLFTGCSNGVVCLTYLFNDATFMLWNPTIREFRILPKPPHKTICPGPVGFGFDLMTNDFKVVRVAKIYEFDLNTKNPPSFGEEGYDCFFSDAYSLSFQLTPVDMKVVIYELSTDSWREVVDAVVPDEFESCRFDACVVSNGYFYWRSKETVIGFWLSDESFRQIPMPDSGEPFDYCEIYALNDSLALLFPAGKYDLVRGLCFDIWVMNIDYGDGGIKDYSWTKKFSIGPLLSLFELPLLFRENGDLVLNSLRTGSVASYNIHTQEIKEYQVYGCSHVLQIVPYKESLISIKTHHD